MLFHVLLLTFVNKSAYLRNGFGAVPFGRACEAPPLAPNAVDPPLGGPTPALRFMGKGAGSAIETDAFSYGYKQHPRDVVGRQGG